MSRSPALLTLIPVLLSACAPAIRPLPIPARDGREREEVVPREQPSSPVWRTDSDLLRAQQLMVPVLGVSPDRVRDTFREPRDGGTRLHQAHDILAPRGTPVLAAVDGHVVRLSTNALGGITIYAVDSERRFVYYYAHLDRYRDGLAEGQAVRQGQVIGYVGTTGNAPEHVPHLHFQVMRISEGARWWNGEPIDARPYLVRTGWAGDSDLEAARRAAW
jgi:peptidoglycan LD-endopeptidase LytH